MALVVPRIVVNAKLYPEVTDPGRLVALAQALGAVVGKELVAFAPPMVHLGLLGAQAVPGLMLAAPHVDALPAGVGTGHTSAESAKAAGARLTILNHAEHKLPHPVLAKCIAAAKAHGLMVVACADSLREARELAVLAPDAIAIEPPELIGGDVSVTSANPAIVRDAVVAVHDLKPGLPVLCGAGVKSGVDVKAARKLGAHGVLVASGVVKAKDPAAALRDLIAGLA